MLIAGLQIHLKSRICNKFCNIICKHATVQSPNPYLTLPGHNTMQRWNSFLQKPLADAQDDEPLSHRTKSSEGLKPKSLFVFKIRGFGHLVFPCYEKGRLARHCKAAHLQYSLLPLDFTIQQINSQHLNISKC